MSKNDNKATVETVVAQAAEEKLVSATVPAQADGEAKTEETPEAPELKVIEGGKKSVKDRVAEKAVSVAGLLGRNKKALVALGAAAGVATLAFVTYAKKKAEEALVETADESTDGDTTEPATDDSAA